MEGYSIQLFENFALTTKIMPYYGTSDQGFLFLSSFWVGSRDKLYEFYEEYRKIMGEYWTVLKIHNFKLNLLLLPTDLFRYNIYWSDQNSLDAFINFINQIKSNVIMKGINFNQRPTPVARGPPEPHAKIPLNACGNWCWL